MAKSFNFRTTCAVAGFSLALLGSANAAEQIMFVSQGGAYQKALAKAAE